LRRCIGRRKGKRSSDKLLFHRRELLIDVLPATRKQQEASRSGENT
jgi:hypothetical protein